ncbi:MAG TPA: alpha/beta fold hydrolase [Aeromicrobium sp.]|nr:alpha/beta fold hydrolase [Aeromicrobium sp.]
MSDWGRTVQVRIGVGALDVRVAGPQDGPAVVLLHGFPQTSRSWGAVVPALAEAGYRVVAPDQRGYSPDARPVGVEHYATDALADDVAELADALGIDTFHLVGHDWGASIAWVAATRHADRIRTLTTVSVPHLAAFGEALRNDPDQQERSAYIGLFRMEGKAEQVLLADDAERLISMYEGRVPDDDVAAYVALLREPGALTAALGYYRAMQSDLSGLPAVTMPTTFVWSSGDRALGPRGAHRCGDFVDADYRFVELADISHWVPDEAPHALAEAIVDRAGR